MKKPEAHWKETEALARALKKDDVFVWLSTVGYYPEAYVLPPCFSVGTHAPFSQSFAGVLFKPKAKNLVELSFPKSSFTDRVFGVFHPHIHHDIARTVCENWDCVLDKIFDPAIRVFSYSFPVSISQSHVGSIGALRSGRMIYEFLEMAESNLVEEAYNYKYLIHADIKNFYPSLYTHSISWALHTKGVIRLPQNRNDTKKYFGNRLDKLFQRGNDDCTNGVPVGPAISDLITEVVLAAVDKEFSIRCQNHDLLAVRFKDDYRFLCKTESECLDAAKLLQECLREYNLVLNEEKTEVKELPSGLFRTWSSKYHSIRPDRDAELGFREFKELYLGVIAIDSECPGTGVIDRFIADLFDYEGRPRIPCDVASLGKTISLLFMLAEKRTKAFPKVLSLIEALLDATKDSGVRNRVEAKMNALLSVLVQNCDRNKYLISWLLYFLNANSLQINVVPVTAHPIIRSIADNKPMLFCDAQEFDLFKPIGVGTERASLRDHLAVFEPRWDIGGVKPIGT